MEGWKIPYLSLTKNKDDILEVYNSMQNPPKVLVCSISTLSDREVQRAIRKLPVTRISIDEAHVCNPDLDLGWAGFLPYK